MPAGAPSQNKSINSWYVLPTLLELPPPPTAVFALAHASSELDLSREQLSFAAHPA